MLNAKKLSNKHGYIEYLNKVVYWIYLAIGIGRFLLSNIGSRNIS